MEVTVYNHKEDPYYAIAIQDNGVATCWFSFKSEEDWKEYYNRPRPLIHEILEGKEESDLFTSRADLTRPLFSFEVDTKGE